MSRNKWRSRITTDGLDRAPHRAFMRAMGLDDTALAKPMIGVVSMKGEQTPCNMTHDFQVAAAKEGDAILTLGAGSVWQAGEKILEALK